MLQAFSEGVGEGREVVGGGGEVICLVDVSEDLEVVVVGHLSVFLEREEAGGVGGRLGVDTPVSGMEHSASLLHLLDQSVLEVDLLFLQEHARLLYHLFFQVLARQTVQHATQVGI